MRRFVIFLIALTGSAVRLHLACADDGRATRESRLDRGALRDNALIAKAPAPPPQEPQLNSAAEVSGLGEPGVAGKRMVGAPVIRPPTNADVAKIKAMDKRYQAAKSVAMDLEKTLTLTVLGRERVSKGRTLVSKGRMRLEIDSPDRSLLVVDRKTAWLVNYPSEEFKGSVVQVVKSNVGSKKTRSQAIVGLLAQGGFLKYFQVVGVGDADRIYFLQPQKQLVEFSRAQARLTADGKDLLELRYWDELGNETALQFSRVRLNVPAPDSAFQYSPPADADVTSM